MLQDIFVLSYQKQVSAKGLPWHSLCVVGKPMCLRYRLCQSSMCQRRNKAVVAYRLFTQCMVEAKRE